MDETEQRLRRNLIAARAVNPDTTQDWENRLYNYQYMIGTVALHATYERIVNGNVR